MNLPDYPFEPHYADIGGLRLHYLDEGPADADPVVMLHGNPSWSYYYRHLVTGLRERYRCIVPDHIGMGLSDRPDEEDYDFHFTQRADDLDSLLTQTGIDHNITLVLHDWGGMIGMLWASRHPEKLKRLVILNTAAFHLPADKKLPFSIRLGRVPLINALLNQGLNAFCRGAVRYCVTRRPMPPDVASAYLAPYDSWSHRLAVRRFVEDIPLNADDRGYDTITQVAASLDRFRNLPVQIIWGMKDFVFDHTFLESWLKYFPEARCKRIEDAGHYVLEDAADEVVPTILDFLDQHPL